MGKIVIINGSPRAPKSNSKMYAEMFKGFWGRKDTLSFDAIAKDNEEALKSICECENLLFVFPLYADSIPVTLMKFLKKLENYPIAEKPTVHVLINCGFFEPQQNLTALEILNFFLKKNGFKVGSVLCIGSGEAICNSPFSFIARGKIKKFANAIKRRKNMFFKITMPIPKMAFVKASTNYWIKYAKKNGVDFEQMNTMEIER